MGIPRTKRKCKDCKRMMLKVAKDQCTSCRFVYKKRTRLDFFLMSKYVQIKQRCTNKNNSKNYMYNGKLKCTKDEFLNKFLTDKQTINLYKNWQKSNFNTKLTPSIDRIDVRGVYELSNMQMLTQSENSKKDKIEIPINMYDLDNNFIKEFKSQTIAAKKLNLFQSNIAKVLRGKRNHTGGYIFKYKDKNYATIR